MTNPIAVLRRNVGRADEQWRDLPLRTRLTTTAAVVATLTIVAVISVAYVTVRHELRVQIDTQLRHQATEYQEQAQFQQQRGFPVIRLQPVVGETAAYIQVVRADGVRASVSGDALPISKVEVRYASTAARGSFRDAEVSGKSVRILTTQLLQGFSLEIGLPLRDVNRQLHVLALAFVGLALGGLAMTVLATWGAVRRIMRPVRSLTDTAVQIAETQDLTLRIASYGHDELGRLADSFNTMLDALERSLGQQRQLVMDASHELRTPLASLRTNVEVLRDVERLTPRQREELIAGVVSQLDELTGLVADVVELARGEAAPSHHEDLAFDELVENAVERAQRHWPGVEFRLRMLPLRVRGVAARLDRAVANLLDNAGKFSPPGSVVDVVLDRSGALSVSDRGPGIDEAALPYVFDRFYRSDEARALPGSGLGLAIAKQVVEGHGGSISVANRPDGGAIATIQLPVDEPAEVGSGVPEPVEETLFL
jgi:two-component system sensor histidine kinase MprB